jgi:NAD+ synthase
VPSANAYSTWNTEEESFFRMPFEILDIVWHRYELSLAKTEMAEALRLSPDNGQWVMLNAQRKQQNAECLMMLAQEA